VQQAVVVEVDRLGDHIDQQLAFPAGLALVRIRVAQGDPCLRSELLDGAHEVEVVDLLHEVDRVTAGQAPEAVVPTDLRPHVERRRVLLVEGAAPHEVATDLLERQVAADQLDDVDGVADPRDVVVHDRHQRHLGISGT
jgi:hypothetical protein